MSAHPLILTLDQNGTPHRWVSWQHACVHCCRTQATGAIGEWFRSHLVREYITGGSDHPLSSVQGECP